jgi:hypothetical protein
MKVLLRSNMKTTKVLDGMAMVSMRKIAGGG